jgi:cell wall-associated NlpC family hydrolase
MNEALRSAIIIESLTWRNTPFVDCGRVKGAGVDCAQFIAAVYEKVLGRKVAIESYSPQWHLHRDEERYIAGLMAEGCREISEPEVLPGDIVLYKVGRCFSHGAIVVEWPRQIIHAVKLQRGVVYADPVRDKFVANRERKFFTFFTGDLG